MWQLLARPWPWYVSGPLIGLFVPVLLLLGNKQLGMTPSLRALCAAVAPGDVEFFRYDWKEAGLWNVALALGLLAGAALLAWNGDVTVSRLLPTQMFQWHSLLTVRGAGCMIGGGFLVGFGSSYAGGCTSGHGIMGMATMQRASVVALLAIFAGGLLTTLFVIPHIF